MMPLLKMPIAAAARLFHGKQHPRELKLTDPEWPMKLQKLRDRLELLGDDDELMQGLIGLLDANVRVEMEPLTSPLADDAEVNRLRGRLGMLLDFKAELLKVWHEARHAAQERRQ